MWDTCAGCAVCVFACGRRRASTGLLTNDSKATVSVLYWYGNYPNLTEQVSDFLGSGPALAPGQLYIANAHINYANYATMTYDDEADELMRQMSS